MRTYIHIYIHNYIHNLFYLCRVKNFKESLNISIFNFCSMEMGKYHTWQSTAKFRQNTTKIVSTNSVSCKSIVFLKNRNVFLKKLDHCFNYLYSLLLVEGQSSRHPLLDLAPFVQFKKSEKHPWRSATFNKVAG